MRTYRLLDLFCGIGGCSVGYVRAGLDVVGVDNHPSPDYPCELIEADALALLADEDFMSTFDAVHASPPCPRYSSVTKPHRREVAPDLLGPTLDLVRACGLPYVVEAVPRSPHIVNPLVLCGSEFDLGTMCVDGEWRQLRRHRWFEVSFPAMRRGPCDHIGQPVGVYGHGTGYATRGYMGNSREKARALGIDWLLSPRRRIVDAIPPAYTEWLGGFLIDELDEAAP